MQKLFGLLPLLCLAAVATAQELPPLDETFERDVLVVDGSTACHRFDVYLALTRQQQRRGLMFVRDLPTTTGMLFVYSRSADVSIWMRNTLISLDIVFARSGGDISFIHRNAETQSDRSISPNEPSQYVLELNAGVTERLGIEPGSRLLIDYLDGMLESDSA